MVTIGIKRGPTKNDLVQSFERFGQDNDDGVLFITDDGTVMVGHLSGLEYDKENEGAFCFAGLFGGKFLRGYYHTKVHKGWIEVDLNDLSVIRKIRMLIENCEKIRTKKHLLLVYHEQIDLETAKSLASNDLVHLPKIEELAEILKEIDDDVFSSIIPMGCVALKKNGDSYPLQEHDSHWVFLADDSFGGTTEHIMYGVAREPDGRIKPYTEIKVDDLPTLAATIFALT